MTDHGTGFIRVRHQRHGAIAGGTREDPQRSFGHGGVFFAYRCAAKVDRDKRHPGTRGRQQKLYWGQRQIPVAITVIPRSVTSSRRIISRPNVSRVFISSDLRLGIGAV